MVLIERGLTACLYLEFILLDGYRSYDWLITLANVLNRLSSMLTCCFSNTVCEMLALQFYGCTMSINLFNHDASENII